MCRGLESEVHARKIQDCHEGAVTGDFHEDLERKGESCRENFHLREYTNNHKQNTGRNIDSKGCSGEVSDENEELALRQQGKGHPCYKMARNVAELCSSVF